VAEDKLKKNAPGKGQKKAAAPATGDDKKASRVKAGTDPKKKVSKGSVKGKKAPADKRSVKGKEKEPAHTPKTKPKLDDEEQRLLRIRKDKRSKKPPFRRQEWFRYKCLGTAWRRPRGLDSKMRRNYKYRPALVHIGYRGPKKVRGLHSSGFEDILIHNVNDLTELDPKKQAVRIGHGVGTRKRKEIVKAAEKKGLRILNPGGE